MHYAEVCLVDQSRITGMWFAGNQMKVLEIHARAFDEDFSALPVGGFYRFRQGGELHGFEGTLIHTLQTAVATDSYATYKRYSEGVRRMAPVNLRDLLDFRTKKPAISADEVESITEIRKRLVS